MVEQLIRNQQVVGSNPTVGSSSFKDLALRLPRHSEVPGHSWNIRRLVLPRYRLDERAAGRRGRQRDGVA